MKIILTLGVSFLALCFGANAQSNSASGSTTGTSVEQNFAVASVRPSSSTERGFRLRTYPGRIVIVGITAKELVEYAYDLKPFQVRGGLNWTDQDKFDISAVTDEATAASESVEENYDKRIEQIRSMTQSLLFARFGLVAHKETLSSPVYELSLAEPMTAANHPGLQRFIAGVSPQTGSADLPGAYNVRMTNVPLSRLAERLSDYLKSPVIDKTDLSGVFNITMSWYDPLDDNAPSASTATLEESLKSRLDMQLNRTRGQIDVLVIDKLDHPSPN